MAEKEKKCNCNDECDCGCNDGKECKCEDEKCNCEHEHKHKYKHEHCNCGHDHKCAHDEEPTIEDYERAFIEIQNTLAKADEEIKKAKNEAMDNQRIAVSYKKDLERFKERNKNIEIEAKESATEDIAKKIIPVIDQFEMALSVNQDETVKKGYQMIYANLQKMIVDLGIEEIDALGQEFDSNFHNAISKVQVKDKKQIGKVTAVYQKGYILSSNKKVIRYAQVVIGE